MGDAYLTNENKLNLVRQEFTRIQDINGTIGWKNSLEIVQQILPNVSSTRVEELLYDIDGDGVGRITFDDITSIVTILLEQQTNSADADIPDEQENSIQMADFVKKLFELMASGVNISNNLVKDLAEQYHIKHD